MLIKARARVRDGAGVCGTASVLPYAAVLCAEAQAVKHKGRESAPSLDGDCQLRFSNSSVYGLVAGHSKGAELLPVNGRKLRQVYDDPAECCCCMRPAVCLQHSQDKALFLEGPHLCTPALSTRCLQQQIHCSLYNAF